MKNNYYKYFPISDEDINWGLCVYDCGTVHIRPGEQLNASFHPNQYQMTWNKGRVLDEFQLIYVAEGQGIFESEKSGQLEIENGSIVILFPGVWHRYKALQHKTWNTYWVGFDGSLAASMISKLEFYEDKPILNIGNKHEIANVFIELINIAQIEFSGYQQVMAGELFKLFGWIYALRKQSGFTESNIDSLMQRAKLQLTQLEQHIDLEEIAKELNIGYSRFRKLFKAYTGLSPGQFRMQHKLKKAMQLLDEENKTIKEISNALGFESTQYFSRVFKLKTGKTPGKFKNGLT